MFKFILVVLFAASSTALAESPYGKKLSPEDKKIISTIDRAERFYGLANDPKLAKRVKDQCNLDVTNVSYADMHRSEGVWGDNIADLYASMIVTDPRTKQPRRLPFPIIRTSNLTDELAINDPKNIKIKVGNTDCAESNGKKQPKGVQEVSLNDFLNNLKKYDANTPSELNSVKIKPGERVLMSHYAVLAPIAEGKPVEMTPELYSYTGRKECPAAMTVLTTPDGTSVSMSDNVNSDDMDIDKLARGKRLYANKCGEKARLKISLDSSREAFSGNTVEAGGDEATTLVQIPIKCDCPAPPPGQVPSTLAYESTTRSLSGPEVESDIAAAKVETGESTGAEYTGLKGLKNCKRDATKPIRLDRMNFIGLKDELGNTINKEGVGKICSFLTASYKNSKGYVSLVEKKHSPKPHDPTPKMPDFLDDAVNGDGKATKN